MPPERTLLYSEAVTDSEQKAVTGSPGDSSPGGDSPISQQKTKSRSKTRAKTRTDDVAITDVSLSEIVKLKMEEEQKRRTLAMRPKRWPWYVLRPDSRVIVACDILSTVALLMVYCVVPFELAFVESPVPPNPLDGLFLVNRFIDVCFWIEMVLTFIKAYARAPLDEHLVEEAHAMLEGESTSNDVLTSAHSYEWRLSRIAVNYGEARHRTSLDSRGRYIPRFASLTPTCSEAET